jgi:hypothetical protein
MRHDNLLQIQRAGDWIHTMQPDDEVLHGMQPDDEVLHQHLETQGWRVRGRATPRVGQLTITDMLSPAPDTMGGRELASNLNKLADLGCSGAPPLQHVSLFRIPAEHLNTHTIFLAGSPANHDPMGDRFPYEPNLDSVAYKECGFYSMCHSTPPDTAVVMTYSPSAGGRHMEFWTLPEQVPERALLVLPAWFHNYRPRMGCRTTLRSITDDQDTFVAIYAPPVFVQDLIFSVTHPGKLSVATTIARWLGPNLKLISFGAYTAELEVDIAQALENAARPARLAAALQHGRKRPKSKPHQLRRVYEGIPSDEEG